MSAAGRQAALGRRYFWRTLVLMLLFTALVVAIDKLLDPSRNNWSAASAWPLVLITCAPLFAYAWEAIHYVRSIDEMQAQMQVRSAAITALAMLLGGAVFGIAEIYGLMEPLNMTMLLPMAAVAHSVTSLVQQARVQ